MKLHLLFVFLLAAPLIGRVLSSESASATDTSDAAAPQATEVQPASAPTPDEPPAPTEAAKEPAPTSTHTPKPAERHASCGQVATFIG